MRLPSGCLLTRGTERRTLRSLDLFFCPFSHSSHHPCFTLAPFSFSFSFSSSFSFFFSSSISPQDLFWLCIFHFSDFKFLPCFLRLGLGPPTRIWSDHLVSMVHLHSSQRLVGSGGARDARCWRHAPKEEASASSPCRVSQTRTRPPPSSQPPPFPHFVFHTMTTRASEVKNIWIAAGDGDLERVKVRLGRLAGLPGPKGR